MVAMAVIAIAHIAIDITAPINQKRKSVWV